MGELKNDAKKISVNVVSTFKKHQSLLIY